MACRAPPLDRGPRRNEVARTELIALALAAYVACSDRDETRLTGVAGPEPLGASARLEPPAGNAAPPVALDEPASSPARGVPEPAMAPSHAEPAADGKQPDASTEEKPVVDAVEGPASDGCSASAAAEGCMPALPADGFVPRPALAPFFQQCGRGGVTRAGVDALSRLPYLQRLSDTAVDILYKRTAATAAADAVHVSLPDGSAVVHVSAPSDPSVPDGLQHLAHVQGLAPDTYYCYSIAGLTERIGFHTAPAPDGDATVRFAVFGDSGDGGAGQAAVRDQLESWPVDLVLHTGDVAYESGTLEQFEQHFFRVYDELLESVPFFPISGNHDHYTSGAGPFLEVFDLPDNGGASGREYWYSFDFGDVHFVGLDTEQVGDEQVAWLDRDLTENQRRWTVVYFHRPPFSSGYHGSAADVEQAFVPLFEAHAVPIVFSGHEHNYERTLPIGGVTYVVTGGGGRTLRAVGASDFTAKSQSVLHLVEVEVRGATMLVRAIDADGMEIDRFELGG